MAVSKIILHDAAMAGEDLSAKVFHFAKINADGRFVLAGAGEAVYGVIEEGAVAGRPATLGCVGFGKAILGGTVATGAVVACDANSKMVVAAAGDVAIGICRKGGAVDEIGEVFLNAPFNAAV